MSEQVFGDYQRLFDRVVKIHRLSFIRIGIIVYFKKHIRQVLEITKHLLIEPELIRIHFGKIKPDDARNAFIKDTGREDLSVMDRQMLCTSRIQKPVFGEVEECQDF